MILGIIYKLSCGGLDYYGSTRDIETRMSLHRSKWNNCSSKLLYEKGEPELKILEIGEYISKNQMYIRENEFINKYPCVNKYRAYQTKEERNEYNKEYMKEYAKTEKGKETIKKWNSKNQEYKNEWRRKRKAYNKICKEFRDIQY
jgi:hypothetical protein